MQTTARPRTNRTSAVRRLGLGLALAALATAGVSGPAVAGAETPPFEPDLPIALPGDPGDPDPDPGPAFPGPGELANPEDPTDPDPDPGPGFPGPGDLANPTEPTDPTDPGPGQPGGNEADADVIDDRPVVATPTFTG